LDKKAIRKIFVRLLLAESADENGILEITDKKIVDLFRSLMIEQTPKWLKTYKPSEPMDFINFNDKRDDETEADFIDRTYIVVGENTHERLKLAKKRGKQFGFLRENDDWNNSDFVHV
jgi:hypothetical protein